MISLILLGVLVITSVLYHSYKFVVYKPHNFPPGPPKIPIFGSYLFMLLLNQDHLHKAADKICKFYKSNIVGLYIGETPVIILNDTEKVKNALYHQEFDGKPDILMGRLRDPNMDLHGIFFTEGSLWHEQRRFALRYLRDYGFGRRFQSLEIEIHDEMLHLIDLLKFGPKHPHEHKCFKDDLVLLPVGLGAFFGNCFLEVLFNERIQRKDMCELYNAAESALQFQRKTDNYGKLYSVMPWIANIFPERSDYAAARQSSLQLYKFMKELIDKQINSFDKNHIRHFIDMYVTQMNIQTETKADLSTFSYEQLILTCIDFSFPALSALSTTVTFLIQQICLEPEIQEKIQKEIDNVVGHGRLPTLDDRINLPYTEAALREIMRYETLVPSGLPHKALNDTRFMGYDIPKDTFVITALNAASHDKQVWKDPATFRPERFLNEDGKLSLKHDYSLPFGAGKRLCAGETFARNMLFLFTSAFFQTFDVRLAPGSKPLEFNTNLTGLIRTTPDHWIQVLSR